MRRGGSRVALQRWGLADVDTGAALGLNLTFDANQLQPFYEYVGGRIQAVDESAGPGGNRSRVIVAAILEFVAQKRRAAREARDRRILDRNAESLNREMDEVLDLQVET